jgi:DNA-binding NarL/FixJ family response regulator
MDLKMPACDGVEATRQLARVQPSTAVVVLTTYADDDWVLAALRAGARGFLTKNASADEIRHAVTVVAAGEAEFDPSVQRRLLEAMTQGAGFGVLAGAAPAPVAGLTQRETEVLTEIAAGLSNTEIAGKLVISDTTVKTHINHLLAKTGARDRAQLVAYAFRAGLAR